MADDAKRETGTGLMFIGLSVWVVDLLVIFFLPAGIKLGHHRGFAVIIVILAATGLALMMAGYSRRGTSSEE